MVAYYDCDDDPDARAAAAILEPYVDAVYRAFLEYGLDKLQGIKIRVTSEARDGDRHFAACETTGRLILLSPHMVELPHETAVAIIGHEMSHAVDFSYPAQFAMDKRGRAILVDVSSRGTGGDDPFPSEWIQDWQHRSHDDVERMADAIAESVMGVKIGYRDVCAFGKTVPMLQTVKGGIRPRPRGLR